MRELEVRTAGFGAHLHRHRSNFCIHRLDPYPDAPPVDLGFDGFQLGGARVDDALPRDRTAALNHIECGGINLIYRPFITVFELIFDEWDCRRGSVVHRADAARNENEPPE